jgi:hypothetical protein
MPPLRNYDILISHAWKYGDAYYRLVELLDMAPNFKWRNLSVPEHDPIHSKSERMIRAALDEQVRRSQIVLMVAGVYASHSGWMQEEVDMAVNYAKPIIGIKPRGNERMSTVVQAAAVELVNWSTNSIVDAIRTHAI